jgi:hypothetical protein
MTAATTTEAMSSERYRPFHLVERHNLDDGQVAW